MPRTAALCTPYGFRTLERDIVAAARIFLPPWTRLKFHRVKPWDPETMATCEQRSPKHYDIHLVDGMTNGHMMMVMIHEVAHAIHWSRGGEGPDHGPAYWKAHGELYCRYLDTT